MKALIWFGCLLVYVVFTTAINSSGVRLGAIPTALLFTAAFSAAKALCQKLDEHRTEMGKLNRETER